MLVAGTRRGSPSFVDFPERTTRAWGLLAMRSVRCYRRGSGTLLAFQFSRDPPRDDESGVWAVQAHRWGKAGRIRIWCGPALKRLGVKPGYYLAHREGPWFVVCDFARPLDDATTNLQEGEALSPKNPDRVILHPDPREPVHGCQGERTACESRP